MATSPQDGFVLLGYYQWITTQSSCPLCLVARVPWHAALTEEEQTGMKELIADLEAMQDRATANAQRAKAPDIREWYYGLAEGLYIATLHCRVKAREKQSESA